jgi:hypothetical protein
VTQVTQALDPAGGTDPRFAVVQSASTTPLVVFDQPLPGKVRLSPAELQAVEAAR